MSSVFYNTTELAGAELADRQARASTQDDKVLAFMATHSGCSFTRDEIHERVLPLAQNTSVTRALNTLMKAGRIEKLDELRPGRMGAQQHLWRFKPAQGKLF